MFTLERTAFGPFTNLHIINAATDEFASIIPEFGGVVNQLVFALRGQNYSILNGSANYAELIANDMFKSSKLFPFPNRIRDGKYTWDGVEYHLPLNFANEGNAIHGLVFNKAFEIVNEIMNDDQGQIELKYSYTGDVDGYPFPFIMSMTYTVLAGGGMICETNVTNTGNKNMPIGDGWHPYFKTDKRVNNLLLKIPHCHRTVIDERMIPTGETVTFNDFNELRLIDETAFDTGFQLKPISGKATTEIYDPELNLKIIVFQEAGVNLYNYLQIYIPPNRTSIAIEPMTCNIDAFNNKKGLIELKPGASFTGRYGVRIE
jgi:aldose 1-epimerase